MALSQAEQFAANADAFATATQNAQAQRSQVALYALNKAATYWSANKTDEAIKEFRKVLAFDPQNTDAYASLGKIYQAKGNTTEAIKYFKTAVQLDRTSVTAHNNLGNAYLQAKQYTDAEKEFKISAKMDPINPLADYTLGILYTQTERFGEAEAQFNKVAKVSPRDGNVPYSLGVLYNKMGRPEDAVIKLEKALRLKSDFPAANYELGAAYVKLGETEKAAEQLSILDTKQSSLANDLGYILNKPKIVYMDAANNRGFNQLLGPRTPLWMLDPTLLAIPGASKKVSVAIQFNNEMDIASVMNPANWEISRAKSTEGGYYNNSMPTNSREVSIPKRPFSVTYDPESGQASVTFTVQQNATGDATIDPSHLVFKFSGTDASGRQMDSAGDQVDGYSSKSF
ncbi:MAG: tetratricopeptide repeat protein [Geobacteraceae bacterium]|nr:tetratricopeptide repeat protein [Geobacteraceae bacterium]